MTFDATMFRDFIAAQSVVQTRISPGYKGAGDVFDIVIVGSGMGGGILADALADHFGTSKRILVIEAGSYLYPTHVYNCSRFSNSDIAKRFACSNFWQSGAESSQNYIHERPQLNFGGRSIFWSGLIPTIQPWELKFFPPRVRDELTDAALQAAGATMNEALSLGKTAETIVQTLKNTSLSNDFIITQTPRALHQPYLQPNGTPVTDFFIEPTGVFNTAELLINQLGLSSNANSGFSEWGLNLLLNHYVEDIRITTDDRLELVVRDTLSGGARFIQAGTVVLAGGSIESPKLLARSTLGRTLPPAVTGLIGRGLTDHPTTSETLAKVTHIGTEPVPPNSLAKIILYSKGKSGSERHIEYPFNVEMNVNHEYWHLRENDPSSPAVPVRRDGESIVDIKFSFANCLDQDNEIRQPPPFGYVPEIVFRNQNWTDHLVNSRLPAVAGWHTDDKGVFDVLNTVAERIFGVFRNSGTPCRPDGRYGEGGKGFGYGTVHHAAGTLRMPFKESFNSPMRPDSVVDEDLKVIGTQNLYVCDMSVMPFASAANPVRTLTALALRLSRHLR